MNDILNIWNDLSNDIADRKIPPKAAARFDIDRSGLLISRMSRNLRYGLYWNMFFIILLAVAVLMHMNNHQVLLLIAALLLMFVFTLIYCGRYYLKITRERLLEQNAKTMLTNYYRGVIIILSFERITSLFFIPMALIAGVLYSFLIKYGSFSQIVFEPQALLITGILIVTAVPLTVLWVSWSQKYAFKSDLKNLKDEIEILST